MPDQPTTAATPPPAENPLLNILLNVLLPVTILSYCSKTTGEFYALGPKKALILATLIPLGYFLWDYHQRRQINKISILGIVSVLFSGGLGLLEMKAHAFALKEACIPLILAAVVWFTRNGKTSLVRALLLNPDLIDRPKVNTAIQARGSQTGFAKLMDTSALFFTSTFLVSAALNYFLALHFLRDTTPGSEAYTTAIGKISFWGFIVIGVPSILALLGILLYVFSGLQRLTGLTRDQLFLPR